MIRLGFSSYGGPTNMSKLKQAAQALQIFDAGLVRLKSPQYFGQLKFFFYRSLKFDLDILRKSAFLYPTFFMSHSAMHICQSDPDPIPVLVHPNTAFGWARGCIPDAFDSGSPNICQVNAYGADEDQLLPGNDEIIAGLQRLRAANAETERNEANKDAASDRAVARTFNHHHAQT